MAAPAIIRPGILMPVKRMLMPDDGVGLYSMAHPYMMLVDEPAPDLCEKSLVRFWCEVKQTLDGRRRLTILPRK
jgi:hypothetical protein